MKKIFTLFLIFISVNLFSQINTQICALPSTAIGTINDWIVKEDANCLTTKKITIANLATLIGGGGGGVTSVSGTTNRITSTGGTTPIINISTSYIGQSSINTVGTLTTGGYQATPIVDSYISSAATWNAKFTLPSLTSGSILFSDGSTIAQNNANLFWNNSTKRLGIGTNNPSKIVHISGATPEVIIEATSGSTNLEFFHGGFLKYFIGSTNGSYASFYDNATPRITIKTDGSGYVGINNASPSRPFISTDAMSITAHRANTGLNAGLGTVNIAGDNSIGAVSDFARLEAVIGGNAGDNVEATKNGNLLLYTATAGSVTEKMRIMPSGNVGIGLVAPTLNLHVKGSTGLRWENAANTSFFNATPTNLAWTNGTGTLNIDGPNGIISWVRGGTNLYIQQHGFEYNDGGATHFQADQTSFEWTSSNQAFGSSSAGHYWVTDGSAVTTTTLTPEQLFNGYVSATGTNTLTLPDAATITGTNGHLQIGAILEFFIIVPSGTCTIALNTGIVQDATASINELTINGSGTNGIAHFELVFIDGTHAILKRLTYDAPAPSGVSNYQHIIFTPTTGGTVALSNNKYNIINPAGALFALTVNLPSSPSNNDVVHIKFTQNVTTVTYGNGTVADGITAPTAGGLTVLVYDSGTSTWY